VLASLYDDDYFASADGQPGYDDYADQEEEYVLTFADDVRRVREFVSSGKALAVGCGYGYFLRAALDAGYDAYGVDVAGRAVEIAADRFPGRVFRGTPASVPELANVQFDVIFASHLIEHITEPVPFVADLQSRLAPGGILVFVTPNIRSWLARVSGSRWVSFQIPEHVAYYDPQTIARLMRQSGLEMAAIDGAYQYYRVPFVMKRLRALVDPLGRIVPRFEEYRAFRDRIVKITSGSLRAIGRRPRP
jgi:2-polyprenyl-3-methyl-5-hydroxy-6-metoxy-1,4-benzoquinol methylase